jgi:hypothetical protein
MPYLVFQSYFYRQNFHVFILKWRKLFSYFNEGRDSIPLPLAGISPEAH